MMRLHPVAMLLACLCIIIAVQTSAQDNISLTDKAVTIPTRFLESINKKTSRLEDDILLKSERALKQLSKQERRLQKKLSRKDSALASRFFYDAQGQYLSLQKKITEKINKPASKEYIPYLDTLTTSLQFLEKNSSFSNNNKLLQQSIAHINSMQNRFQQAKEIQQFLRTRREYLKGQLSKYNMAGKLKQYNKKIYYYQAQIEEYKNMVKQPEKIERKAIDLLSKAMPFQGFMNKYSILGSIFPGSLPAFPDGGVVGPGLQTSVQVNTLIQQVVGPNNLQALQSNVQQAQSQIQQLKNKINEKSSSSDNDLPNFRPNNQRVKSFWNRWELGTNLQSTRSNEWLPSATQIGLSAGYKLNDRSVIGVGMAGSIDWGKDIKHVAVTYDGVGVRSYLDWKIKGSFWISGGYELNHQQIFTRIEQLKGLNAWQKSGLVGISKKYKAGKKLKGNMSLLWDWLSYSQIPRTQPILFRIGYALK